MVRPRSRKSPTRSRTAAAAPALPDWGERLVGVHCSTAGGLATGIERGAQLGCTAIQIFSKNNNRWLATPIHDDEVEAFQTARANASIKLIFAHAGYLINLASAERDITEQSMESLRCELNRAYALGLAFVVLHPGAHKGDGELAGIRRIADRLNILIEESGFSPVRIVLEGTAGQGTSIGHRFEHLRDILGRIHDQHRVGVCLDTAHLFAAGYDFRTPKTYATLWDEFDRIVGRRQLCALHLNDSKVGLGSHVDRHEHLGRGKIGPNGFRLLLRDATLARLPMVCETPKGVTDALDRKNLAMIQQWIGTTK
ncbi:MAG: deoxyribonuclease IV [Deltaproteobacteria bacterium]|nr:deoxyribonuclease IV [Deltaproteobacteria bacterium]